MSGKLKREIRSRYVEYIVLYAVFNWPICLITKPSYRYIPSLSAFLAGTKYVGVNFDVKSVASVVVLFSGVIIAVQRLRDRLILDKLKSIFICICCCKSDQSKVSKDVNLNTFLATSLNTELVVTILKGITILAAGSSDITDNMNEQEMLMVQQIAKIKIDQIKIMNAKRWEIGLDGV
jgi:hypothetical protein